ASRTAEMIDRFLAGPPRAHEEERASPKQQGHDSQNDPKRDVVHTRHRLPLQGSGRKRRSDVLSRGPPVRPDHGSRSHQATADDLGPQPCAVAETLLDPLDGESFQMAAGLAKTKTA